MILENTFNLIEEIKAKHLAYGAAGLAGAGLIGTGMAKSGLFGKDIQHAYTGSDLGYTIGQMGYDAQHGISNPGSNIDRIKAGISGSINGAKFGYNHG